MFDLDQAITNWRRRMADGGVKSSESLDELEAHLRDHFEEQTGAGLSGEQAFDRVVREIGGAEKLNVEFKKIRLSIWRKNMQRTIIILAALFGTVFGGALVLPDLGRWHRNGTLVLWPLLAGVVVTVICGWALLYLVQRPRGARGRKLIGLGIIAAGAFYVVPLVQAFFVQKTDLMGWIICAFLAVGSVFYYGTCFRLNRHLPLRTTLKN